MTDRPFYGLAQALEALHHTLIPCKTVFEMPERIEDLGVLTQYVGHMVESSVPRILNQVRSTTWDVDGALERYEFARGAGGFPDVVLADRTSSRVLLQLEVKSWFVLAQEGLSARFTTARSAMGPECALVVLAYGLDGFLGGRIKIHNTFIDDAHRIADARDAAWKSMGNLVEQPDPSAPAREQRSNVKGLVKSNGMVREDAGNFGKLGRMHDALLDEFRRETLTQSLIDDKSVAAWRTFMWSKPKPTDPFQSPLFDFA